MYTTEQFRRYLALNRILPAPMCGYSDRPFRDLLRQMGAGLLYTEMYASEAVVRGDPKTFGLMDYGREELPLVVQIFGAKPHLMAETARIAVRLGASVVDLNMGCPAKKIVRSFSGSALLDDPERARGVIRAVRRVVSGPFTVKMRWRPDGGSLDIARMAEAEGVDAIALHGRTRAQGYTGEANWEWIARMKQAVRIPVIGNGDIRCVRDAEQRLRESGCDAVMVGRALVGNPWLMRAAALWAQGRDAAQADADAVPDMAERLRVMREHARLMHLYRARKGLIEFRKHCGTYLKGLPNSRRARPELMQVETLDQLHEILDKFYGPDGECLRPGDDPPDSEETGHDPVSACEKDAPSA